MVFSGVDPPADLLGNLVQGEREALSQVADGAGFLPLEKLPEAATSEGGGVCDIRTRAENLIASDLEMNIKRMFCNTFDEK